MNKNSAIGFLSSILLHILLLFALWLLLSHKPQEQKSSVKYMALKLDDFKREWEPPAQTPSIAQPPSKPQKPSKKQPTQKTPVVKPVITPQPTPIQQAVTVQKTAPDTNATHGSPKRNSVLDALNARFANQRQSASAPIKQLYGDEFDKMNDKQKEFINNNLSGIGRITEKYLRYPDLAGKMGMQGTSVVEFMLHPNGDISELKLLHGSNFAVLDKNSIQTIETAYKDYPRPSVSTKIRIFIHYSIY